MAASTTQKLHASPDGGQLGRFIPYIPATKDTGRMTEAKTVSVLTVSAKVDP
jgi:hypothetical protein